MSALVAVSLLAVLTAGHASAQPAITTCALSGVYVLAAALASQDGGQFSGEFAFTPPPTCVAGAPGTVQVQFSVLFAGSTIPAPFAATLPYTVDNGGNLTIGIAQLTGALGVVTDTGIANSFVFEADAGIFDPTLRFAGTALRVNASNTIDNGNTIVGAGALASRTSGNDNTATGLAALGHNTTGALNTAVGGFALTSNTTGNTNTAAGFGALGQNTTGGHNAAFGSFALVSNTTGESNTATGFAALGNNMTGSNNVAIGNMAGVNATTGNDNIYIGHQGVAAEAATIRLGTAGTQIATFIAGISEVNVGAMPAVLVTASGQLGVNTSSRRFKEDIRDMGEASTGLLRLRPVAFRYKKPIDGSKPLQYGLIAEEVAEVYPELVANDREGQPLTVLYHLLPALLLNEMQHQHRVIEGLQAQLQAQAAQLSEVLARLARLEGPEARSQR